MYIIALLPIVFLLYHIIRISKSLIASRSIPGPFWARISDLWYFQHLRGGRFEHENIRLHQEHGPIVQIGPNHFSISDAASVKMIYGPGSKFAKSAWYDAWKPIGHWSIFADRDIKRHCSPPSPLAWIVY